MRARGTLGALLALALVGFAGEAAAAVDLSCTWSTIPAAKQAAMIDQFRRDQDPGFINRLDEGDLARWTADCGFADADATKVGMYIAARTISLATSKDLEAKGVTAAALEAAWKAVAPQLRKRAGEQALAHSKDNAAPTAEIFAAAEALRDKLGLSTAENTLVAGYVYSRAAADILAAP